MVNTIVFMVVLFIANAEGFPYALPTSFFGIGMSYDRLISYLIRKDCKKIHCKGMNCAMVTEKNGCQICTCPIGCDRMPPALQKHLFKHGCPNPLFSISEIFSTQKRESPLPVRRWYREIDAKNHIDECRSYNFPLCSSLDYNLWRSPESLEECLAFCFADQSPEFLVNEEFHAKTDYGIVEAKLAQLGFANDSKTTATTTLPGFSVTKFDAKSSSKLGNDESNESYEMTTMLSDTSDAPVTTITIVVDTSKDKHDIARNPDKVTELVEEDTALTRADQAQNITAGKVAELAETEAETSVIATSSIKLTTTTNTTTIQKNSETLTATSNQPSLKVVTSNSSILAGRRESNRTNSKELSIALTHKVAEVVAEAANASRTRVISDNGSNRTTIIETESSEHPDETVINNRTVSPVHYDVRIVEKAVTFNNSDNNININSNVNNIENNGNNSMNNYTKKNHYYTNETNFEIEFPGKLPLQMVNDGLHMNIVAMNNAQQFSGKEEIDSNEEADRKILANSSTEFEADKLNNCTRNTYKTNSLVTTAAGATSIKSTEATIGKVNSSFRINSSKSDLNQKNSNVFLQTTVSPTKNATVLLIAASRNGDIISIKKKRRKLVHKLLRLLQKNIDRYADVQTFDVSAFV